MQFIDPHHRFEKLRGRSGDLYHTGSCSVAWPRLLEDLDRRNVPHGVTGDFAWVYIEHGQDSNREFSQWAAAMVDHLSSTPLFISKEAISYSFASIVSYATRAGQAPLEYDRRFFWESQFLWGFTASNRTLVKNIERLLPCHRWVNGTSVQQLDLRDYMGGNELQPIQFREALEHVIARDLKPTTAVLVSGGTDSATMMAAIHSLGLENQTRLVSMRSRVETTNESHFLDQLAQKLKLKVHYFEAPSLEIHSVKQPKAGEAFFPSEMFLWKDYSFIYRKQALTSIDRKDIRQVMTGECGDQLFGGPKLSKQLAFISQSKEWSARDFARQYIHLSMFDSSVPWFDVKRSPLVEWYESMDSTAAEVYEELISSIANTFDGLPGTDLVNRILNINLIYKGPYRLFHSSQDEYEFFHPFAKWDIVRLALATRSTNKIFNGGRLKEICYQAFKNELIDEAWEAPKTGNTVPIFRTV